MDADSQALQLQDGNRELQILKKLCQQTGSEDAKVKALRVRYIPLVKLVVDAQLDKFAKKVKGRAGYLTGLSGIASFLASVQIGFVPLIGVPDCRSQPQPDGCNGHEILIRGLIFFFAYLALSLDALGALFALLTARALYQLSSDALDLVAEKYTLDGAIIQQLNRPDPQRWVSLQSSVDDLYNRVQRQDHYLRRHTGLLVVISFIFFGMVCFFIGLILLVIQSQPLKFWVPFVLSVFTMVMILVHQELSHNTTRIWKAMEGWVRGVGIRDVEKGDHEGEDAVAFRRLYDLDPNQNLSGPVLKGNSKALHAAAEVGNLETVKLLLENGADVNVRGGEYGTALQTASYFGYANIVLLLLAYGADVNAQGGKNGTALYAACKAGKSEIVKLLIEKGADVSK
ncbi:hypothetical protein MVEN_00956900 [Mycena venus]|uniref:Ankyrin repeat protein n=1 Tax=Mycena venus TaxID=2733690 RepID=A0A8H6YDD3_9AGAR|nr:hypothetical protein MVEN_00956900 [Mycena venus]